VENSLENLKGIKKRFDSHRRDRCRVTSCHESAGCYPQQQQQQQQKQTNNQVYAVLARRDTAKAKPNSFVQGRY